MKFSHKIAKIAIDSFALFVISLNSSVFRERSKYEETYGGRHSQDEREEARLSSCARLHLAAARSRLCSERTDRFQRMLSSTFPSFEQRPSS